MAQACLYHGSMRINYRRVLAQSVKALMNATPALSSHAKLAKKCSTPTRKIGARTIGHLLDEDGPQPQLDTLVAVAEAFKVELWLLFLPEFDAKNPDSTREMFELARRIAGLPRERQALLMEIFGEDVTDPDPRPPANTLQSPRAPYKKSAKP